MSPIYQAYFELLTAKAYNTCIHGKETALVLAGHQQGYPALPAPSALPCKKITIPETFKGS